MHRRRLLATLATLPLLPRPAFARAPEIFQKDGLALGGWDPVGYFTKGAPVKGEGHRMRWKGAVWDFSSDANAVRFGENPVEIAPEFGGYCAYAAAQGALAPTIPEAWTIYEGRLYLNANLRARDLWLRDIDANIAKGRANWPGILG